MYSAICHRKIVIKTVHHDIINVAQDLIPDDTGIKIVLNFL